MYDLVGYYNPTIGRFTTEDPIGMKADNNFFRFVNNNPINGNDPFGLLLSDDINRFPDPNGNKVNRNGGSSDVTIYDYIGWTASGMINSIVNAWTGSQKSCPCEKVFWDCMQEAFLPGFDDVLEGAAFITGNFMQSKAWKHAASKGLPVPLRSSKFRFWFKGGKNLGPFFAASQMLYDVSKCLTKEMQCLKNQ